jgi:hypothetical protein
MDRKAKLAAGFVLFGLRFLDYNHLCYKYPMIIIDAPVSLADLKATAGARFGNLVKAVVDVERKIMALDGELHADEEALLLENGSPQENLWAINIYPELEGPPGQDRI